MPWPGATNWAEAIGCDKQRWMAPAWCHGRITVGLEKGNWPTIGRRLEEHSTTTIGSNCGNPGADLLVTGPAGRADLPIGAGSMIGDVDSEAWQADLASTRGPFQRPIFVPNAYQSHDVNSPSPQSNYTQSAGGGHSPLMSTNKLRFLRLRQTI